MKAPVKAPLKKVGRSKAVVIPASFLEENDIGDSVYLEVFGGIIMISKTGNPREGWEEQFEKAGAPGNNEMLYDDTLPNDFDEKEWTW